MLNEQVIKIAGNQVSTKSGKKYNATAILLATDAPHSPLSETASPTIKGKSALTFYFSAAQKTPVTKRIALNTIKGQLINNIAFMDHIAPFYAPADQSLISVSVCTAADMNIAKLEQKVRAELLQWYPNAADWQLLSHYEIPYALPNNETVNYSLAPHHAQISDNCYICGEPLAQWALLMRAMISAEIAVTALRSSPSFNREKQ